MNILLQSAFDWKVHENLGKSEIQFHKNSLVAIYFPLFQSVPYICCSLALRIRGNKIRKKIEWFSQGSKSLYRLSIIKKKLQHHQNNFGIIKTKISLVRYSMVEEIITRWKERREKACCLNLVFTLTTSSTYPSSSQNRELPSFHHLSSRFLIFIVKKKLTSYSD